MRIDYPPRDSSAKVRVPAASTPPSHPKKPSGVLNERHTRAQDPLYERWIADQALLELIFTDGSIWTGILQSHDTYTLFMKGETGEEVLVFKQSLRSIRALSS